MKKKGTKILKPKNLLPLQGVVVRPCRYEAMPQPNMLVGLSAR